MSIRTTLSLGLAAAAAAGVFATAPAEAAVVCEYRAPLVSGCVHVNENGCVVYGSGTLLGGPFTIRCTP